MRDEVSDDEGHALCVRQRRLPLHRVAPPLLRPAPEPHRQGVIDFYMALPADDGAIFTRSYEFMDGAVGANTKLNPVSKLEEGNLPLVK